MTARPDRFSTRRLFEELDGCHFDHFDLLEAAVRDLFTGHLADFPVNYDYWDALTLAETRGWLVPEEDGGLVVRVDKIPA